MHSELFSVAGQVVIVTGTSRGIGQAIASGFASAGAKVVRVARSESTVSDDNTLPIQVDITDRDAPKRICRETVDRFGKVDVLVNNAGMTRPTDDPYNEDVWTETLSVNLTSAFRLSRAVSAEMESGGSIINVASIGAVLGFPGNPSYQAAKGGLRQLTKAMAHDFAEQGIRVNCVCPGYIRTDMTAGSYANETTRAARTDRTLLGRWGEPEDLVGPCLFLASSASSYMTGGDLFVDGGWTAKGL